MNRVQHWIKSSFDQMKTRLYQKRRLLQKSLKDAVKKIGLALLRRRNANGLIPLDDLRYLQRVLLNFGHKNPLSTSINDLCRSVDSLKNSALLARIMNLDVEFGNYSLDVETLNFLEVQIKNVRPSLVLEFGSGVSTLCLAHYMREIYGEEATTIRIISLEQDDAYAKNTQQLLEQNNLASQVRVIHAPVIPMQIAGIDTSCYDVAANFPSTLLQERKVDYVIVDGPSGGGTRRFGTIPLIFEFLAPSTTFVLDDALRDWELWVAAQWQHMEKIEVVGVHLIGKGLLVGRVH